MSSHVPPLVEPGRELTSAQVARWSRHLLMPEIGEIGQRRLRRARVCVVGAGGLGAPVLLYLAAAGVGRIGVVDDDVVALSNLQRQVVHGQGDVGRPKVVSAAEAVHRLDGDVEVVQHRVRLTDANADEVLGGYDLVVDGTDTFTTRYLVNDACVRLGLPEVWGSVLRMDAQVSVFWGRPPTGTGVAPVQLRDLFPEPPPEGSVPSCSEAGVLGALCGQVGSLMATEAIKLITGAGEPLIGRVLVLDALASRWSEVPLVGSSEPHRTTPPPAATPLDASDPAVPEVSARELAQRLAARDAGEDDFLLVDVREPGEHRLVSIPGSVLVPLAQLDGAVLRAEPFRRDRPVVLMCRSGVRSERAARQLVAAGFADVSHLTGGVLAWVSDVDPSLPTY
jgi:molybdopterin/thiamine biosynthesis adenylyltransferase/rhodanese-related sulfurtransferase